MQIPELYFGPIKSESLGLELSNLILNIHHHYYKAFVLSTY